MIGKTSAVLDRSIDGISTQNATKAVFDRIMEDSSASLEHARENVVDFQIFGVHATNCPHEACFFSAEFWKHDVLIYGLGMIFSALAFILLCIIEVKSSCG